MRGTKETAAITTPEYAQCVYCASTIHNICIWERENHQGHREGYTAQREKQEDWNGTWPAGWAWKVMSVREGTYAEIHDRRRSERAAGWLISPANWIWEEGSLHRWERLGARVDLEMYNLHLGYHGSLESGLCFDMQPKVYDTGSSMSLLPEVRKNLPFGRWGPVSQVPEEFWLLSNHQQSVWVELISGLPLGVGGTGVFFGPDGP